MFKGNIKNLSLVALVILSAFLVYLLFQAHRPGDYSGSDNQEVSRVPSPDSLIDAVEMANVGGPATATVVEQIYLVSSGGKPEPRTELFVAVHQDSLWLHWLNDRVLLVHYRDAEILFFNNKVSVKDKTGREKPIEVRLETQ